jgi:hypothetical protein
MSVIFYEMLLVSYQERNANIFMAVVRDLQKNMSVEVILNPTMFDSMLIQLADSGNSVAVDELLEYMELSSCPPPQKLVSHVRYFATYFPYHLNQPFAGVYKQHSPAVFHKVYGLLY